MFKKFSWIGITAFLGLMLFVLPAKADIVYTALTPANPAIGATITVNGSGFTGYTATLYPQSGPYNDGAAHFPSAVITDTTCTFTLGTGEGVALTAGGSYKFAFSLLGDPYLPGLNFTVASSGGSGIRNTCMDEDPSNDPYIKGYVYKNNQLTDEDICDGDTVYQASCKSETEVEYFSFDCPNGCQDGVCLKKAPVVGPAFNFSTPALDLKALPVMPSFITQPTIEKPLEIIPITPNIHEMIFEILPIFPLFPTLPGPQNTVGVPPAPSTQNFDEQYKKTGAQDAGNLMKTKVMNGLADFSDVNDNLGIWYAPAVNLMAKKGIIAGYKDQTGKLLGEFRPSENVNIAEALKMIMIASGKNLNPNVLPLDTKAHGQWFSPYVALGEEAGLTILKKPRLNYNQDASRGEVACMVKEAFNLPGQTLGVNFADLSVRSSFYPCFAATFAPGIFTGDAGKSTIRPNDSINRAEMAKIITLAMETVPKICFANKGSDNLSVYEFRGEPVLDAGGKPQILNGNYTMNLTASVMTEGDQTISDVNVHLLRHDLSFLSGNTYAENLKEITTPSDWQNLKLNPGRIYSLSASVPVPADSLQSSNGYDFVHFTLLVDLPENKIDETIDLADNIFTAWMAVKESKTMVASLGKKIVQRSINFAGQTQNLNAYKDYASVLANYFKSLNIKNLDKTASGCLNLKPVEGSLKITELSSDKQGVKIKMAVQIEKQGKLRLPQLSTGARLSVQPKDSNKPLRVLKTWLYGSIPAFANDDGSQNKIVASLSEELMLQPDEKEVMFILDVDPDDMVAEKEEMDNRATQSAVFSTFEAFTAGSCSFNPNQERDIWVMDVLGEPVMENGAPKKAGGTNFVEVTAEVQSYMLGSPKVNLHLFQHQVSSAGLPAPVETLREINVPGNWKNVELQPGVIHRFKAHIPVLDSDLVFDEAAKAAGVRFTVIADLPENKTKETEEISNNFFSRFVPVRSAQSAGSLFNLGSHKNLSKMIAESDPAAYAADVFVNNIARDVWFSRYATRDPLPADSEGKQSLIKYYEKQYQIQNIDQAQHKNCTNLEVTDFSVSTLGSTATDVQVRAKAKIRKHGELPLPRKFTAAQFYYRPAGANQPYRITYTWDSAELKEVKSDSGSSSNFNYSTASDSATTSFFGAPVFNPSVGAGVSSNMTLSNLIPYVDYELTADVMVKPYAGASPSQAYDYRLMIDPENEISEVVERDNEKIETVETKVEANVDLTSDKLIFGPVYLQGGYPVVDVTYNLLNKGTQDVLTEFYVRLTDKNGYGLKYEWSVPEVKKGLYTGKRTISLPVHFQPQYEWSFEVDINNDLLDSNRINNTIWYSSVPLSFAKDLLTVVEVKGAAGDILQSNRTKFAGLNSGADSVIDSLNLSLRYGYAELDNSFDYVDRVNQTFPLPFEDHEQDFDYWAESDPSLRLKMLGQKWKFKEFVEYEGPIFRAGIARVDCSIACGYQVLFNDLATILAGNGGGVSHAAMNNENIWTHLGNASTGNAASYNNSIYYYNKDGSFNVSENTVTGFDWLAENTISIPKEDAVYIVYGSVVKHWATSHESSQVPGYTRESAKWNRLIERAYQDAYTDNNYRFLLLEIKSGKIAQLKDITPKEAFDWAVKAALKLQPLKKGVSEAPYGFWPKSFEDALRYFYAQFPG